MLGASIGAPKTPKKRYFSISVASLFFSKLAECPVFTPSDFAKTLFSAVQPTAAAQEATKIRNNASFGTDKRSQTNKAPPHRARNLGANVRVPITTRVRDDRVRYGQSEECPARRELKDELPIARRPLHERYVPSPCRAVARACDRSLSTSPDGKIQRECYATTFRGRPLTNASMLSTSWSVNDCTASSLAHAT